MNDYKNRKGINPLSGISSSSIHPTKNVVERTLIQMSMKIPFTALRLHQVHIMFANGIIMLSSLEDRALLPALECSADSNERDV